MRRPDPTFPRKCHRHAVRRVLLTAGVALGTLSACGGATGGTLVQDVAQTAATIEEPTTTSPATSSTTTEPDPEVQDLAVELSLREIFTGSDLREVECAAAGLLDHFGADGMDAFIAATVREESLDEADARRAATIIGACMGLQDWLRAQAYKSFDVDDAGIDCIAKQWKDADIELLIAAQLVLFEDRGPDLVAVGPRFVGGSGSCLSATEVEDLLLAAALSGHEVGLDDAQCYADKRIADAGPAEALRIEFGFPLTIAEATSLYDAMVACFDMRAYFAQGLEEADYDPADAACVADHMTEADIRMLNLSWLTDTNLGRDATKAFDHLDAADVACGVGSPGA